MGWSKLHTFTGLFFAVGTPHDLGRWTQRPNLGHHLRLPSFLGFRLVSLPLKVKLRHHLVRLIEGDTCRNGR